MMVRSPLPATPSGRPEEPKTGIELHSVFSIGNAQLRLDRPRLGNRWKEKLQAVLEFMATSARPQPTTGQVAKVG